MSLAKHSKQKDAIFAELRSRQDHPTAEDIYLAVKPLIPNLSLGTVYRNLNKLTSDGSIIRITVDGADRYDADMSNHYHMICSHCGKVYDVFMPEQSELNETAQKYVEGKIVSHSIIFSGLCKECLNLCDK